MSLWGTKGSHGQESSPLSLILLSRPLLPAASSHGSASRDSLWVPRSFFTLTHRVEPRSGPRGFQQKQPWRAILYSTNVGVQGNHSAGSLLTLFQSSNRVDGLCAFLHPAAAVPLLPHTTFRALSALSMTFTPIPENTSHGNEQPLQAEMSGFERTFIHQSASSPTPALHLHL